MFLTQLHRFRFGTWLALVRGVAPLRRGCCHDDVDLMKGRGWRHKYVDGDEDMDNIAGRCVAFSTVCYVDQT